MPQLNLVIDVFNKGFQYLNESGQRQSRWFEFWFKIESLKKTCANMTLTTAIESVVKGSNQRLIQLKTTHGNRQFAEQEQAFVAIIADMLHLVQVQRFVHGDVQNTNYHIGEHSVLERTLHPQKPGFFETTLIAGLESVKAEFPELNKLMDNMIVATQNALAKPVDVFREEARNGYSEDQALTTMGMNYHSLSVREKYAQETISTMKL